MVIAVEGISHTDLVCVLRWTPHPHPLQEQSMLQYLEDRFAERVAAVLAGLAAVVAEVSSAYRAVDLHLPRSAEMVAEYMGPR